MKVLYITNMYPTEEKPYYGIFVKEQVDYIENCNQMEVDINIFTLKGDSIFTKYFNVKNLYKEIKKYNPDIIHIHYGLSGFPLLLLYPFIRNKIIVTTFHGSDINGSKMIQYISLLVSKISHLNIAVSQEIFMKLNKNTNNLIWLPCGIDESFFEINNEYIRENNIIFPSSPARDVKNFTLFQDVINILNNRYNINPNIIIFENKSREEIKKILLTSKCMLMTSKSEGSPQVIKEAIATNLPIVSTPVGDVPFLINDKKHCYTANNAEELAKKVALIFQEKELKPNNKDHKLGNKYICNELYKQYKDLIIKKQKDELC